MNDYTLLKLDEVVKRIGWQGELAPRRVKARLQAAERRDGLQIMEHSGRRRPILVRWELAESHLPRCRSAVDALTGVKWREFLDNLDQRIADRADQRIRAHHERIVAPELLALWKRDEVVAEAVRALGERMAELARE